MTPANAHIARVLAGTNEVREPAVTSSNDPAQLREALDKMFELFVQERIFSKELVSVLSSALQTAEFERHPYRAWHGEARRALKKVPQ